MPAGATLNGIDLGSVSEETVRKEASLVSQPLYTQNSDKTDVLDYGGAVRIITVTGTLNATSVASLKTKIDQLEALIQGQQDTNAGYPITYTSDLRGSIKVKVAEFETTWSSGAPLIATYSLRIMESSTNS